MIVTEGLCLNNVIQIRTHQRRNQISEKGTQRPIISFNIHVLHYTRYLTMKIFDIRQTPEGQKINVYFLGHHSIVSKDATLIYFIDILNMLKWILFSFFLNFKQKIYISVTSM